MTDRPPEEGAVPRRPGGLGRRLRVLAGVNETILDRVPLERTLYTGLGGVVLGTAAVAAVSMWFFLGQMLDGYSIAAIVPVLIWALIVLNLDRWLISKSSGMWQRRVVMLIPRLLLAVVLGFIIAEPMVLRAFETAVEQHVVDERVEARRALRAKLVECNPLPPATPSRSDCGQGGLLLASTSEEKVRELREAERDAAAREKALAAQTREHRRLRELARKECAGDEGAGLSGKEGKGPRCYRLYDEADAYAADNRLVQRSRELDMLKKRNEVIREELAGTQGDVRRRIDAAIDKREAELPAPGAPIGFLERARALDEMTAQNGFLLGITWLLRLLLIMIDCMPVLVKLLGGTNVYDRLVELENGSRERVYAEIVRTREHAEVEAQRLERERTTERLRRQRQSIDMDRRQDTAWARSRIEDMIKDRAADLLGESARTKQASNGSFHLFET
ncbi:DUF4407 domain-containing protein [Sphaerisporangium sp. NPDC051011]|uniref:DUF4407 domain-containing protein n=1 Tax=Sphaerisporangium sp. NPDC051011 TaxID=3155792 RepID=UPI0034014A21